MSISADIFESHQKSLWALCYRMTGSAADADDLVQETFVRALQSPPRLDQPLRPWFMQVAVNLSRDLLRARKRRSYIGQWLPSPVSTDEESPPSYEPAAAAEQSPFTRYDMIESVSLAFLIALEALTPSQRAVLLLRDVFDYSTAEAAEALGITETSAKVLLHRARARMRDYDRGKIGPLRARGEAVRGALEQFIYSLSVGDVEALERLLAEDVVAIADGGGEVAAALRPIKGRNRVARFFQGLAAKTGPTPQVSFRLLNGLPALVVELGDRKQGFARRFTLHLDVNDAGQIREVDLVLAPAKLTAVQ